MGFWQGIGFALLFIGCVLLLIGLHESGHIVAGKLVGFRFFSIQVGPVVCWRTTRGLHFGWGTSYWKGGMASMYPTDSRNVVQRYRWFVAGGPIASFLPVVPCVIGTLQENAFAALMLLPSLMGLIGSAAPREVGEDEDLRSDGAILTETYRDPEGWRRKLLLWSVLGAWEGGRRPRVWPIEMLADLPDDLTGEERLWANLARYYHSMDTGEPDRALAEIEAAEDARGPESSEPFASIVRLEAAFRRALASKPSEARALLESMETPPDLERIRLRAEAAVLHAELRDDEARKVVERARAEINKATHLQDSDQAEIDMLDMIFAKATIGHVDH